MQLDGHEQVSRDLNCIYCGYNLRGLKPAGVCPECGAGVANSLRGDLLQYSDPAWVKKVASGPRWILAAWGIGLALSWMLTLPSPFAWIFRVGVGWMPLMACWRFTSPEPRDAETEDAFSLRRVARFGGIGGYLLAWVLSYVGLDQIKVTLHMTMNPPGIPAVAGWVLILAYAGRLARRVPHEKLAKDTRIVVWGLAIGCVAELVVMVMSLVLPTGNGWGNDVLTAAGIAAVVPTVVLMWWSIKLLFDYRKHLNHVAQAAKSLSPEKAQKEMPCSPL